ncbi:hypothetical protein ACFC26_24450 [Kitasatospora purpeofusca]|uniref:hypothetical protein n=1 Tax=Kitasatospora purpeofusca TaxID=67352 RepID=UPI0004BEC63C|nr:hypothetical protein [Kitasatospora purpeofusca]
MTENEPGYDYWFRLEIEVSGSPGGRSRLKELLAARGWIVSAPSGTETAAEAGSAPETWIVEAGVNGSRWGAAQVVKTALERARRGTPVSVELKVLEPIVPSDPPRTRWLAHLPLPSAVRPDWLRRPLLRSGLFDTGREIFLPTGPGVRQAAELATVRALTESAAPPHNALPRLLGPSSRVEQPSRRRQHVVPERIGLPIALTAAVVLLNLGTWLNAAQPHPLATGAAALLLALLLGAPAGLLLAQYGTHPEHTRPLPASAVGWAAGLVVIGTGLALPFAAPSRQGAAVLTAVMSAAFLAGNGLRLLFRNLSRKAMAAWLVPALLPLALPVLPVPGFSLHTYYLDYFDASREEVFIPVSWQLIADTKGMVIVVGPLVALALLGYARHFHAIRGAEGIPLWGGLLCVALMATVAVFWVQVLTPATEAAAAAATQARAGSQPEQYFGIAPQRVCVRPAAGSTAPPFQGSAVSPDHPYLAFPSSADWIRLWDLTDRSSVVVKREHWQIIKSSDPSCPVG